MTACCGRFEARQQEAWTAGGVTLGGGNRHRARVGEHGMLGRRLAARTRHEDDGECKSLHALARGRNVGERNTMSRTRGDRLPRRGRLSGFEISEGFVVFLVFLVFLVFRFRTA
jgi:hypothetical protein